MDVYYISLCNKQAIIEVSVFDFKLKNITTSTEGTDYYLYIIFIYLLFGQENFRK